MPVNPARIVNWKGCIPAKPSPTHANRPAIVPQASSTHAVGFLCYHACAFVPVYVWFAVTPLHASIRRPGRVRRPACNQLPRHQGKCRIKERCRRAGLRIIRGANTACWTRFPSRGFLRANPVFRFNAPPSIAALLRASPGSSTSRRIFAAL